MASSGKKGKKNKGTVISLQSFLSNGDTPSGTTQVAKKIRNLDGDDSDEGSNALPLVYQLPTAPRANRIFDDESLPHKPPFIACVNNLPFDVNEEDIYDLFGPIQLVSLRLPREDGETGRSRGFGYVELESRDDLIYVLSLPDPSIRGRRIRIEFSNENEQQNTRQKGNRRFEGFGNSNEGRDSGNWRRDNQNNGGYSNNYDRGYNRDRERKPASEETGAAGSWRSNNKYQPNDSPPLRRETNDRFDRFRENRYRNQDNEEETQQERPKLNLKPRTLPLPEIVTKPEMDFSLQETDQSKTAGVTAEKVFGSAKPVDTASRELEIEERLAEARRLEKQRREQEQEQEQMVNDKMAEIQIDKYDKENANLIISWRRKNDITPSNKSETRKFSPPSNDRRHDQKDGDYNKFNKNRGRNERSNSIRSRPTTQSKDNRGKDDFKNKKEYRNERPRPRLQPNQSTPVLQSSNKYSGLDEDTSD